MNYYKSLLALVRRFQKRQRLSFRLRNLLQRDIIEGFRLTYGGKGR